MVTFWGAARLQWSLPAALLYGSLGVAAAVAGGWWPARAAQALPPAQTLKGLGSASGRAGWVGFLIAASAGLAALPPVLAFHWRPMWRLACCWWAALRCCPGAWPGCCSAAALAARHPLTLLALERARRMRGTAAIAVGGVVASLSLAVALTVMVASFRGSVIQWLDAVLPSPLYVRSALQAAGGDAALLPPALPKRWPACRVWTRYRPRAPAPATERRPPALTVLSRPLGNRPPRCCPHRPRLPVPAGQIGVYVSEAVVDLWRAPWPGVAELQGFCL